MSKMVKKILDVEFLDHVHHTGIDGTQARPIVCRCIGVCYREDKQCYYIASWISENEIDHNAEIFVILKSAVKKVKVLK